MPAAPVHTCSFTPVSSEQCVPAPPAPCHRAHLSSSAALTPTSHAFQSHTLLPRLLPASPSQSHLCLGRHLHPFTAPGLPFLHGETELLQSRSTQDPVLGAPRPGLGVRSCSGGEAEPLGAQSPWSPSQELLSSQPCPGCGMPGEQGSYPTSIAPPSHTLAHLGGTLGLGLQGRVGEGAGSTAPQARASGLGFPRTPFSSDREGYFTRCMILNGISTICSTP